MLGAHSEIAMAPGEALTQIGFGRTARRDRWWTTPLLTFLGLGSFVVYTTWAALQGKHYAYGNYLSPFYSPVLFGDPPHAWFGPQPGWWPEWLLFTPAILILWAPGGFRLTCYYYRGAYYKAFWADPPSCAVSEPRSRYRGEASLPLILQNAHRYFLYVSLPFLFFLARDVWKALWFDGPSGERFGIGLGTLVLAANVVLLGGYALGCHSLRHVVGGGLDRLSGSPVRRTAYDCVSCLNRRHMSWAWASLFGVALADLYVRLCSMGILKDWRIF
jgi:hypothetical protein